MFDDDKASTPELHDLLGKMKDEGLNALSEYHSLMNQGKDVSGLQIIYAKALTATSLS